MKCELIDKQRWGNRRFGRFNNYVSRTNRSQHYFHKFVARPNSGKLTKWVCERDGVEREYRPDYDEDKINAKRISHIGLIVHWRQGEW